MPSITITFSSAHATRIGAALEHTLELDAPATADDLKGYIVADVKNLVRNAEKKLAEAAVAPIDYIDLT